MQEIDLNQVKMNKKKAFSLIELSIVILIIGIIVGGVTQGSRLIDAHRLSAARSMTESSPVASIPDLALWLEGTSEQSFNDAEATDGGSLSTWKDINPQSTAKNNATQSNPAARPTYVAKGLNNLPVVKFDGATQFLDIPYGATLNSIAFTMYIVLKPVSVPPDIASYASLFSNRSHSPGGGYTFYIQPIPNYYRLWLSSSSAPLTGNGGAFYSATANKAEIIAATYADPLNNSDQNYTMYYLSAKPSSITSVQHFAMTQNPSYPFRIGAGSNDFSLAAINYFYNGYIAELIFFDRKLKTEERQSIETYLSKKWGL